LERSFQAQPRSGLAGLVAMAGAATPLLALPLGFILGWSPALLVLVGVLSTGVSFLCTFVVIGTQYRVGPRELSISSFPFRHNIPWHAVEDIRWDASSVFVVSSSRTRRLRPRDTVGFLAAVDGYLPLSSYSIAPFDQEFRFPGGTEVELRDGFVQLGDKRFQLASLRQRAMATVIDSFILSPLLVVPVGVSLLVGSAPLWWFMGSVWLPSLVFDAFSWTPGKAAIGLKLIRSDGNHPGPVHGIVRGYLKLVFGVIGLISGVFDGQNRTLYDKVAATYVVRRELPNMRGRTSSVSSGTRSPLVTNNLQFPLSFLAVVTTLATMFVATNSGLSYEFRPTNPIPREPDLSAVVVTLPADALGCIGTERRVCFVGIGDGTPPYQLDALPAYYASTLGASVGLLPQVGLAGESYEGEVLDYDRKQLHAEGLLELMRRTHPTLWLDPDVTLVGVTWHDMYSSSRPEWNWLFSQREGNFAIVSTARMDPTAWGDRPSRQLLEARMRKMVSKSIGVLHYHLPQSNDPSSSVYCCITGLRSLDGVAPDPDFAAPALEAVALSGLEPRLALAVFEELSSAADSLFSLGDAEVGPSYRGRDPAKLMLLESEVGSGIRTLAEGYYVPPLAESGFRRSFQRLWATGDDDFAVLEFRILLFRSPDAAASATSRHQEEIERLIEEALERAGVAPGLSAGSLAGFSMQLGTDGRTVVVVQIAEPNGGESTLLVDVVRQRDAVGMVFLIADAPEKRLMDALHAALRDKLAAR
jgi:uncharacterized RDD family membrane protein YckC/predicted Zn-dependent protease